VKNDGIPAPSYVGVTEKPLTGQLRSVCGGMSFDTTPIGFPFPRIYAGIRVSRPKYQTQTPF